MVWLLVGSATAQVACAHDPRFICSPRSAEHPVRIPDVGKSWAYYGGIGRGQSDTFAFTVDRTTQAPWNLLVDVRDANNAARPSATLYNAAGSAIARVGFADGATTFYEPFSRESYLESRTVNLSLSPGRYSVVVTMPAAAPQRYVMAIGEAERFSPLEIPYVIGAIARIRALRY